MNDWDDYLYWGFIALLIISITGSVSYIAYQRIYHPTLFTVRHGDSVHRNSRIAVSDGGVIDGTDGNGNRFIYRDGWEAKQEAEASR